MSEVESESPESGQPQPQAESESAQRPPPPHVAVPADAGEPAPGPDVVPDGAEQPPPKPRRLRRPTLTELGTFVGLVVAVVGLVYKFAPGCEPQPPPNVLRAEISDVRAKHPISFRRFLQHQQLPIPPDLTPQYLAQRGVMLTFHYEIVGLSHKDLPLAWDLSDAKTNEIVNSQQSAYELTPSRNDDAGDWAVWVPAPKPGRDYYVTVKIFKPEGPPYELKHFETETFPGFPS